MAKNQKYSYMVQEQQGTWEALILRQASYKTTVISKQQSGFASEEEATSWAEDALQSFMQQQVERNQRKADKRAVKSDESF